ncbi:FG-GAP repeat domain-containing protein, partial [Calditrichota bacterium]
GDLNGDGLPDLSVVNYSSHSVSVLLNTTTPGATTPTFSSKFDFICGSYPTFVAIGDLNVDGKPDLTVTNSNSQSVSVFINTTAPGASTPSFSAKADFVTGNAPYSVSTGDLNGDGLVDLSVANFISNNVSILLNTTTPGSSIPTFSAKTDFTTGNLPYSVSIADLNGDGKRDLAVANSGSFSVSVFLNNINIGTPDASFGTKTDFTTGTFPRSVSIKDLNGNGKPDLVVANGSSNSVSVLLNTTTPGASVPTFSAKTDFTTGTYPLSVSIADLNGNGKPDLALGNQSSKSVSVLLNTTTPGASVPTFSAKTDFTIGNSPSAVVIGDLNGDGKPDLAVTNGGSTVSVLLNTTTPGASTPSFSSKTDFATGTSPESISINDLNGDGLPDLAVVNYNSASVSVLLNLTAPGASTPSFSAKTDFTTGNNPRSVATEDLNGDGKPDLALVNYSVHKVSVFINTTTPGASTPSFSARTDFTTGWWPQSISVKDLNGNGKPDLVTANSAGANVSILLNTTIPGASIPTFSTKTDFTTGSCCPSSVAIKDLNGDGKPDLAATVQQNTERVAVFLNSFTTTFVGIYGNIKSYLQGPYSINMMDLSLNTLGIIPLSQPFNIAPWNYTGTENVTNIPAGVVDWVLIELRTGTTADTKVNTRAAFIKSDGSIVDLDGINEIGFTATPGNYYVIIRHRNHLPVMSSVPLSLSINNPTLYDFTTDQIQAYGSNSMKDLGGGKWGMIAGDGNHDGTVLGEDYTLYQINQGEESYHAADFNLDGAVLGEDYTLYQINQGLESSVPELVPQTITIDLRDKKEKKDLR